MILRLIEWSNASAYRELARAAHRCARDLGRKAALTASPGYRAWLERFARSLDDDAARWARKAAR